MKSSAGTRRVAAAMRGRAVRELAGREVARGARWASIALAAIVSSSCAAPQPDECAAYLACFYPEGKESPYADDPQTADLVDNGERVHATYGPDAECWRQGVDDPLYQTCLDACITALAVECSKAVATSGSGICVEELDGELKVAPADGPEPLLCAELTDG